VSAYILRRLLYMIPLLLGVSVVTFALIKAAPGDPVTLMLAEARSGGAQPSRAELEQVRKNLGLDKPVVLIYTDWLKEVLRGNLGRSFINGRPVTHLFREKIPNTVKLSGVSLALSLVIALPLGVISAVKQYSPVDYLITLFSFVSISLPAFWISFMLIYVFSLKLDLLPAGGMQTAFFRGTRLASLQDSFLHYVLPVTALTLGRLAAYIRYQRASMLDVLRQDYVRTARAKGMSEFAVLFRHAWRNSLLSIITLLGYSLVALIEGSVIVEVVFSWPGMGLLGVNAVIQRDYPVIMGIVMLSSVAIILGTLLSDILYAWADPRVRYG
jgi:peptide/nickel transport system permease protein